MGLNPVRAFPPGEYIKDSLEERGWSQQDLADIMGRPLSAVSDLIAGKRGVTADTALGLSEAFGTSAELWLNLESKYRLWLVGSSQSRGVRKRARLYEFAPIREMISRGWIDKGKTDDELESNLCSFFGVPSLEEEPSEILVAARKGTSYDAEPTPAQRAWIQRVRNLGAEAPITTTFSQEKLNHAIDRLKSVMGTAEGVAEVAGILADAGIAFVVVRHLHGTRFDGACLFAADRPVVCVSLRYGRIDHFWFVLFHELAHVAQREMSIDEDVWSTTSDDERPVTEVAADQFAASSILDPQVLERFIASCNRRPDLKSIRGFAEHIDVHPALVIGQLQHRGIVGYNRFRRELVDVRSLVVRSSISDGWEAA